VLNAWFALALQIARLGLDAQHVMALRLLRLSGGGAGGLAEAQRMIDAKMAARSEAQLAAATGALTGDGPKLAKKVREQEKTLATAMNTPGRVDRSHPHSSPELAHQEASRRRL
jgi:hypothetical protein